MRKGENVSKVQARILHLLRDWAGHAERYWYEMPDRPALGCYGTGYNAWGVQTNQKYLGAMAVLSALGADPDVVPGELRDRARGRALAALRFSLHSHVSGDYHCTDGTQWGHTWISALGIERMMHGVYRLAPWLSEADRSDLRRVLSSEADWLLHDYHRGAQQGIVADRWNHTGKNAPESNLWNGAILWRAAMMYPEHGHAGDWQQQAHRFLMNAISVPADAGDERLVAGRPVKEWHVGASFFPNYALDHHGYLNVGYMIICLSNAAMLHFDMQAQGFPIPESLYHHNRDLWQVVRKMLFADGRLARIGGDGRLHYTYCQEYLLPTLVYAADALDDAHALGLLEAQLEWIEQEAAYNADGPAAHRGSFYGRRLAPLAESSPYYYTRLESDRACALGMAAAFLAQPGPARLVADRTLREEFELSVSGQWCEPEHGAVLQRGPLRLASFAWRAHGLAQGMCQPPDDGHLAEWSQNLGGLVRFLGDDGIIEGGQTRHRELAGCDVRTFDGGFLTWGTIVEGVGIALAEGWHGEASAEHRIVFAALPDERTAIGLEHCRTVDRRTYLAEAKGLHLNLPNDLFNQFARQIVTAQGQVMLRDPPAHDRLVELGSTWATVDGRLGVVGLYGAGQLVVHQSCRRRGGKYASLYVDEICFGCALGTTSLDAQTVILDVGWAVLSSADAGQTERFAVGCVPVALGGARKTVRGASVQGLDGRRYVLLYNLDEVAHACSSADLWGGARPARDLVTGEEVPGGGERELIVEAGQTRLLAIHP